MFTVTPFVAGTYVQQVKIGARAMPYVTLLTSPYTQEVAGGAVSPENSVLSGPGIVGGAVDATLYFNVLLRDSVTCHRL